MQEILFRHIHGSVYRDSILIRSYEMQQYAGVYLLQNYSTYFGCLSHPSSVVYQTVTAASGTGHSVRAMLPAGGRQHRRCIIPQTVTHSLVLLKMGKIISRNMLS